MRLQGARGDGLLFSRNRFGCTQYLQLFFVSQTGGLLGTQEFAPLNAGVCQLGDRWLLFV